MVWAEGSETTGTYRPFGLDCSGFVDWVFYNASDGQYLMGRGGGVYEQHTYCADIFWEEVQPGDLVFFADDSRVGIVGGWDEGGNLLVIHCGSGANKVVIEEVGEARFAVVGGRCTMEMQHLEEFSRSGISISGVRHLWRFWQVPQSSR